MSDASRLIADFFLHPGFPLVVLWWLAFVGIGILFLPLTQRLFRGFCDGGYLFARVIGLLLSSYIVWLLSSLGLANLSRTTFLLALLAGGAASWLLPGALTNARDLFRNQRREILIQEYLFLAALLAWAMLRSMKPEINGIEKFLNLGYVNAVLRAESMPPADMWMAGAAVNYYYFGHFFTACMCVLTGIPAEIAYNLMLPSLFAFGFSLSYALVSGLLRRIDPKAVKRAMAGGLLAAFLLALGGNLHPFVYGVALPSLKRAGLYAGEVQGYWYPKARSFIGHQPPTDDKTIHEFPFYSFVIADLHAHVLDTPASLVFIGAGASLLMASEVSASAGALPVRIPYREAVAGVLLGVTWMTNSWNYPIYLVVLFGAALVAAIRRHGFARRALLETLLAGGVLALVSQAAIVPYMRNFVFMTEGVHRVMRTSPLWQLAILWGYQAFFALCFALFFAVAAKGYLRERDPAQGALSALLQRTPAPDIVALGMFSAGCILVLIPEVVYVKDIYRAEYHRANTMFKMAYQASLLFALASGYASARIAGAAPTMWRRILVVVFALVAVMPMTYGWWALPGFYGTRPPAPENYQWLDGLAFLSSGDREMIRWFQRNVSGQPAILEAEGDSYTQHGRISMATGLPTVLGWYGHAWSMRGSPAEPQKRRTAVRRIYESGDPGAIRSLLEEYDVRYIVVGALEREKFKNIKESVLEGMGEVVFRHPDGSVIIEVHSSESKEEIEP